MIPVPWLRKGGEKQTKKQSLTLDLNWDLGFSVNLMTRSVTSCSCCQELHQEPWVIITFQSPSGKTWSNFSEASDFDSDLQTEPNPEGYSFSPRESLCQSVLSLLRRQSREEWLKWLVFWIGYLFSSSPTSVLPVFSLQAYSSSSAVPLTSDFLTGSLVLRCKFLRKMN